MFPPQDTAHASSPISRAPTHRLQDCNCFQFAPNARDKTAGYNAAFQKAERAFTSYTIGDALADADVAKAPIVAKALREFVEGLSPLNEATPVYELFRCSADGKFQHDPKAPPFNFPSGEHLHYDNK